MFIISDYFTLDPQFMLNVCIGFSFLFGICVVTSYNPMVSILYLIGLFISVAGYLYYINLGLMSLLYLLIYVGAIAILFLFILSLLDVKLSELKAQSFSKNIPFSIFFIFIWFFTFFNYFNNNINLLSINKIMDYRYASQFNNLFDTIDHNTTSLIFNNSNELSANLSAVLVENWYNIYSVNELTSVGSLIYTEYAIVFIIMGITLLLSIIGAIVVTTLKKNS